MAVAPRVEWPLLLALPDELESDGHDDLQELLVLAATPAGRSPLAEAAWAATTAPSLMVALELLEAWSPADEAKHPRWPEGTPGGLGGKFMKTGQRFSLGGIEYDVAFTAPGGVYAHVATKGDISKAKLVWIPTTQIEKSSGHTVLKGVQRPKVDVEGYKNAAHGATAQLKATTIDPYVQDDHDPTIPIPPEAPPGLTPERWQRFGRADQLRYVDLMNQFGKWGDSKAQTLVNAELSKKPSDLVAFVKQAYASQFGSSSGFTIGLLQTFSKWFQGGHKPTEAQLEADRQKYEQAKQVQDAAARVIQWDLYNRVKAPSIAVFHKSHDSVSHWKSLWLGKEPIFSGLSQTQRYTSGGFGPIGVASPLAIRNIVMATTSANIAPPGGFVSEQEVSVGEPMRYDTAHTLVFNDSDLSPKQRQWLTHQTQNGTDGSIIDILRANIEQGVPLPSLPEPANLQMQGEGGQQWVDPPAAAKVGVEKLGYANVDANGVPIAKPAKELDLKAGDYIEGMKGTRYIVVANPGSDFGVSYMQLTDGGHPVGEKKPYVGQIHDQTTGHQAFGGHSPVGSNSVYEFQTELPFKKLAGHFSLPTAKSDTGVQFVQAAWATSGDQKLVKDIGVGGKFYLDGVPYEVEVVGAKTTAVKSLASGKSGTINSGYKTNYLKLKEGYSEEGVPTLDPADFFEGAPMKLSEMALKEGDIFYGGSSSHVVAWKVAATHGTAPLEAVQVAGPSPGKKSILELSSMGRKLTPKPPGWTPAEVGDTFAYEGKKATVTKLLKGGKVQANLAPGVVKLDPDDPALAGLFGPSKHDFGPKMKVKDMTPGQKFHGGTGGIIRPYVVVELGQKQPGKAGTFAKVRNLDTGEDTLVGYQKSYVTLVPKGFAVSAESKTPEQEGVGEVFNPAAWKPAASKIAVSQLKVGDKFLNGIDGQTPMEIVGDKGAVWDAKNLMTGGAVPMVKSDLEVAPLVPSNVMPAVGFDPAQYKVGAEKKLADLKPGDIFKGPKAGKFYLVTKTGAKSGLSAVDLATGNKSGPWQYSKVAPVMEHLAIAAPGKGKTPGSAVLLSSLDEGEQFTIDGSLHQVVTPADPKNKEHNVTVAAVLPGGGLGFPGKIGFYPGLAVTFHATKADAAAAAAKSHAEAVALTAVPDDLPAAHPVVAFSPKSKSGGGYLFTLAKHAQEGMVLSDKAGHHWKVKVAGADPVVSDGFQNVVLPGDANLKIIDGPFEDHAPALTQAGNAAASQAAAVTPTMTENTQGYTLGELDPAVGEFFSDSLAVYKVVGLPTDASNSWKLENVETGTSESLAAAWVPAAYGPKPEPASSATPDVWSGAVQPETTAQPSAPALAAAIKADLDDQWVKNDLVKVTTGMLKPGQLYKSPNGNTWLWHGNSNLSPMGWAELVGDDVEGATSDPHPGGIYQVPQTFVPAEVGPIVDFHTADWEPASKALMSNAQPGEVISLEGGLPLKVVATVPEHGNLVVVPTVPLSEHGQGKPYVLKITPATQVGLWVPKPTEVPAEGEPGYKLADIAFPSSDPGDYAAGGSAPLKDLPAGSFFTYQGGLTVLKVLGTKSLSATQGSADVIDANGQEWEGVDGGAVVNQLTYKTPPPPSGHPLDSFVSWKSGTTVGDLKPGDQFGMGSGDSYAIWQVTGPPNDKGLVPTEVVAVGPKTGYTVGEVGQESSSNQPDWTKKMSSSGVSTDSFDPAQWEATGDTGLVQNMLGTLTPGTVVKSMNGSFYKVTGQGVTSGSGAPSLTVEQILTPSGVEPDVLSTWVIDPKTSVEVYAPAAGGSIPGGEGWTDNPFKLKVSDLPPGAKFVWGGGADVYTVKSVKPFVGGEGAQVVTVYKNEGEADQVGPTTFGTTGYVPKQLWMPPAFAKDEVVNLSQLLPGTLVQAPPTGATVQPAVWRVIGKTPGTGGGKTKLVIVKPGIDQDGKPFPLSSGDEQDFDTAGLKWHVLDQASLEPAHEDYLPSPVDRDLLTTLNAAKDEESYFNAENAVMQHLGLFDEGSADPDNLEVFDQWAAKTAAVFKLPLPEPPGAEDYGAFNDPTQWYDETTAGLPAGTEFETQDDTKWVVTASGTGWTTAEPIGNEGEGLAKTWATTKAKPPQGYGYYDEHALVHILSFPGGPIKQDGGAGEVKLSTLKPGDTFELEGYQGVSTYKVVGPPDESGMITAEVVNAAGSATVSKMPFGPDVMVKPSPAFTPGQKVLVDGELHTVYESLPAGVTVTNDSTGEMTMVPHGDVTPATSEPGEKPPFEGARQGFLTYAQKGDPVWLGGKKYSVGAKSADGKVTLVGGSSYPDETVDHGTVVWFEPKDEEPWKINPGDSVTTPDGNPGWVKYVATDANGHMEFGVGTSIGSTGASDVGAFTASQLVKGHPSAGPPPPEKGTHWKAPSGVVYKITSVKKGQVYGLAQGAGGKGVALNFDSSWEQVGTSAGLTPNPDGKSFLELGLGVGDKIESYQGQPETVTKVYGTPGTNGHVYDTVNDVTGVKSTYGTGGTPSGYSKAADAGEATAAQKGMKWQTQKPGIGGYQTQQLPIGTHIMGVGNVEYEIVGHKDNVTQLKSIKGSTVHPVGEVFENTNDWVPGKIALPQDEVPWEWGAPKTSSVSELQVGDEFKDAAEDTWQVIEKWNQSGGEAAGVLAVPLGSNPEDVTYNAATFYGDEDVTITKRGGGQAAPPAIPSESPLKPYSSKSKSGGGYFFSDLGDLEIGDLFTDKSGTVYLAGHKTADGKVEFWEQSGHVDEPPFHAPADTRVKVVPQ